MNRRERLIEHNVAHEHTSVGLHDFGVSEISLREARRHKVPKHVTNLDADEALVWFEFCRGHEEPPFAEADLQLDGTGSIEQRP